MCGVVMAMKASRTRPFSLEWTSDYGPMDVRSDCWHFRWTLSLQCMRAPAPTSGSRLQLPCGTLCHMPYLAYTDLIKAYRRRWKAGVRTVSQTPRAKWIYRWVGSNVKQCPQHAVLDPSKRLWTRYWHSTESDQSWNWLREGMSGVFAEMLPALLGTSQLICEEGRGCWQTVSRSSQLGHRSIVWDVSLSYAIGRRIGNVDPQILGDRDW